MPAASQKRETAITKKPISDTPDYQADSFHSKRRRNPEIGFPFPLQG